MRVIAQVGICVTSSRSPIGATAVCVLAVYCKKSEHLLYTYSYITRSRDAASRLCRSYPRSPKPAEPVVNIRMASMRSYTLRKGVAHVDD